MQSYGILDVLSPPGWTASVDSNQIISWQPTAGTVYLGQPQVTFSVLSSFSGTTTYDQPFGLGGYQKGLVGGSLYTLPDYHIAGSGYEEFSFIGPQAVPEPSSFMLFGCGMLLMGQVCRIHSLTRITKTWLNKSPEQTAVGVPPGRDSAITVPVASRRWLSILGCR
jgi:hypothetical protein